MTGFVDVSEEDASATGEAAAGVADVAKPLRRGVRRAKIRAKERVTITDVPFRYDAKAKREERTISDIVRCNRWLRVKDIWKIDSCIYFSSYLYF